MSEKLRLHCTPFSTIVYSDDVHVASVNSLEPGWQLQGKGRLPLAPARIKRTDAEDDARAFVEGKEIPPAIKASKPKYVDNSNSLSDPTEKSDSGSGTGEDSGSGSGEGTDPNPLPSQS